MWTLVLALLVSLTLVTAGASSPQAGTFIRVVQDQGIWWFQDGDGRRFFSLGVNCVGGCFGHAEDAPLPPSRQAWMVSLLQAWGFNTAGAWSSPSVWDALDVTDQIYAAFAPTADDVFDEAFWGGRMADRVLQEVQPFLGRKRFIGYFLDNEPGWPAPEIFDFYVRLAKDKPGSQALITYLKAYYHGRIDQLNRDWGTVYASFEQLPGARPPQPYPPSMRQGLVQAWRIEVASTYYRRYAAMVRALDPDHLLLGIRYQGVPDEALFTALSPYFDVNSINDYTRYGQLNPQLAELYQATGKPILLTEFSFSGFPEPGHASALFVDVYSQANRGLGYRKYVQQAAQAPFMVGMHWFMWRDYGPADPSLGGHRPDRNVGLVSSDETTVYQELGAWITRTHAEVETLHRAARWNTPPVRTPVRLPLQAFQPRVDGDLTEWPRALRLRPAVSRALADGVQADHTYFIAWQAEAICLAGDIADSRLEHPPGGGGQGDYLRLQLRPVTPPAAGAAGLSSFFLYPVGGGADGQQPYATGGEGSEGRQQIPLPIATRLRPGGYTLEACIPAAAVEGFQGIAGAAWHVTLVYQNVHEISLSRWDGVATLHP
jgi:hypothetical protein